MSDNVNSVEDAAQSNNHVVEPMGEPNEERDVPVKSLIQGFDDKTILEDIYLKVLEATPDAIVIINEIGKIVVFNQQAEFMFGWARVEMLGKPVENLIPEALRNQHETHRKNYVDEPRAREMGEGLKLNGLHRSGRIFPVQVKLAPIMIARAGLHVLAVIRKIKAVV